MKKFIFYALAFFLMQNSFGQTKKIEDNLISIKLITYKVQIADTSHTDSDVTEHILFTESESKYFTISNYTDFCVSLKSVLKDSSSLIFADPWDYGVLSKTKLTQMQIKIDTFLVPDPDNIDLLNSKITESYLNFTQPRFIKFYESWSINCKTMEIKKEVIGYEPIFSVEVYGQAEIRSYFIIFNNIKNYDLFLKLQANKNQLYQD